MNTELIKALWWQAQMGYNDQRCEPDVVNNLVGLVVKECLQACSRASEIRSLVPPTREQSCLGCMREIENTFGVNDEQI
jgi:hypothetical protein